MSRRDHEHDAREAVRGVDGKVLLIDQEKCNGCMLCAIACSIVHCGQIDLERSHVRVWRTEGDLHVPLTCHHCETPSCAQACPTKACRQDHDGKRVLIDDSVCIGCQTCVVACPFGHAHYDHVSRVSTKCDYCDGEPECVRVCEPRAIRYVYSDDSSIHRKHEAATVQAALRLDS